MKTTQDKINDKWNELVNDVYEEWKDMQMKNDAFLLWLDRSGLDEDLINELTEVYVNYKFDYDVFLGSEENLALIKITESGVRSVVD